MPDITFVQRPSVDMQILANHFGMNWCVVDSNTVAIFYAAIEDGVTSKMFMQIVRFVIEESGDVTVTKSTPCYLYTLNQAQSYPWVFCACLDSTHFLVSSADSTPSASLGSCTSSSRVIVWDRSTDTGTDILSAYNILNNPSVSTPTAASSLLFADPRYGAARTIWRAYWNGFGSTNATVAAYCNTFINSFQEISIILAGGSKSNFGASSAFHGKGWMSRSKNLVFVAATTIGGNSPSPGQQLIFAFNATSGAVVGVLVISAGSAGNTSATHGFLPLDAYNSYIKLCSTGYGMYSSISAGVTLLSDRYGDASSNTGTIIDTNWLSSNLWCAFQLHNSTQPFLTSSTSFGDGNASGNRCQGKLLIGSYFDSTKTIDVPSNFPYIIPDLITTNYNFNKVIHVIDSNHIALILPSVDPDTNLMGVGIVTVTGMSPS
jgi:hypothetical protein